ncbi:MAG: iron-containing alcohol dehydrogenase [Deltaproteobacteria bacterium]|nr:iron-containing alcohol dehydrogenase [Deltaproteobacteria bacterium]
MPLQRRRFNFPTRIEYGPGALEDLPGLIKNTGLTKGLLVTDEGVKKTGTPQKLLSLFKNAGIHIHIFSDIKPNPTDHNCYQGAAVYKETGSEFIVALGGGSPLDTAKVIKILATHDGPIEKYDDTKGGDQFINNNMPPLYAIPTTAGTGSEVGRSGLVTINQTKVIIFSPFLLPQIAVLDPMVTVSLPKALTASTGVDAFVHALEAFMVNAFHPLADGLAKEALALCYQNLPLAVKDGGNIEARGIMLTASAMGAIAFQKGLGLNHSIAHALGALFDCPHGLTNAALMIPVLKYNASEKTVQEKLATLAHLFGTDKSPQSVINKLSDWLKSIDMPVNLKQFNIPADKLGEIEAYVLSEPCLGTNPRRPKTGEICSLLTEVI